MTRTELITLVIIGGGLWALIQFSGLKFWHAAVVLGAGLYLAAVTSLGTQIHHVVASLITASGH